MPGRQSASAVIHMQYLIFSLLLGCGADFHVRVFCFINRIHRCGYDVVICCHKHFCTFPSSTVQFKIRILNHGSKGVFKHQNNKSSIHLYFSPYIRMRPV